MRLVGNRREIVFALTWAVIGALLAAGPFPPALPSAGFAILPSAFAAETQTKSHAERIGGIRRVLEADRKRQSELEETLAKLERDFLAASERFTAIDARHAEQEARLKAAASTEAAAAEREVLKSLETERTQARDQFDRLIKRRKTFQEQLEVLTEKIGVTENALEKSTELDNPQERKAEEAATQSEAPAAPVAKPLAKTEEPAPGSGKPAASALLPVPSGTNGEAALFQKTEQSEHLDERVQKAKKELTTKQRALREAEQALVRRDRAIEVIQRDLESSAQVLEIAHEDLRIAKEAFDKQAAERQQRHQAGADEDELRVLQEQSAELERTLQAAQRNVERQQSHLEDSKRLLAQMQEGREKTVATIEQAQVAVESSRLQLQFVESPLAPHRIARWMLRAGPRIVSILLLLMLLWWLSRIVARRVVSSLLVRSIRGTQAEREGRAETLRRVFQSTASTAIVLLGVLALLDQAGVNVTVLLGGAAVLGAAVAFGSQNLIKDYFSGFMILVENQYSVGNVIRIGTISGVVEDITLRMTALRDEEGIVHFLPHSQVTTVSNLTHGWSRAVFKIGVGPRADVDHVMRVLLDLANELRQEEGFRHDITDAPDMQGVDALTESGVVIKFLLRTRPLRQWAIKRELLRRIKLRFDELGIELPYPQQIVHMQYADDPADPLRPREPSGRMR